MLIRYRKRWARGWALDRVHNSRRPFDRIFALCDPVTLTFEVGYPKIIPYTKFEHFRIIRFWVILRRDTETDRRTDAAKHFTPATVVGVSNYRENWHGDNIILNCPSQSFFCVMRRHAVGYLVRISPLFIWHFMHCSACPWMEINRPRIETENSSYYFVHVASGRNRRATSIFHF